jgi:murein DD-endopeptidase MepM/ murein hydrolase activator NlpD
VNQRSKVTVALAVLAPVGLLFVLLGTVMLSGGGLAVASASCRPSGGGATVDPGALPAGSVAGYSGEQLVNAALIMNAGAALELSVRGQTIGVMTAMGESTLRVLDRGDLAGPDSRGLFQQRDNGAWGSYADRMDPTISATNFFRALQRVNGWETLSPTAAAHAVQRNADPNYYTRFWDPAGQVVAALTGVPVETLNPGGGALACSPDGGAGALPGVPLPPGAWTKPAIGPLTSVYGMRWGRPHNGIDIAPPCSSPIYAAASGTVVRAGPSTGYGNLIAVDHGGDVVTRYAHMYPGDVLTAVSQTVVAGQQIGRVGSYGDSTGCHLHFEVLRGGAFTDPLPFLASVGVSVQ